MVAVSQAMMIAAFALLIAWTSWYVRRAAAPRSLRSAQAEQPGKVGDGVDDVLRAVVVDPFLVLLGELPGPHQDAR